MSCPTCHSNDWAPAHSGGGSFLKRLFGKSTNPSDAKRKCKFCGITYEAPDADDEEEEARIEARRQKMEERMSGFRDSQDSLDGAEPKLHELAAGIEMREQEGIKCIKCGHFAFVLRKPDSRCPKCDRVYAKMEEDAEREKQAQLKKLVGE